MLKTQLSILILLAGGVVYAQSTRVGAADRRFIDKADQANLAEVKLGQLAVDKGSSQAVKAFGKRMVDDHTKANDQLKSVASSDSVTLPASLDAKDQALYDRLSKLSGDQFDREYMQSMVKDHEADVAEFQRESKTARTADVRSFASNTLPTLESHLKQARDVSAQIGATASK